ncbi:ankyrin repeat-containing domain protein [Aspergillus karnatakaensis]|uniref:ankyrin repeat domain-containing protein n=1 Tax=Aspergillus karnatakaensis TaxID=1810916 RepID=UPI003CCDB765
MAHFDLFNLPDELVLGALEQCRAGDLASFAKASPRFREDALNIMNAKPIDDVLDEFKGACLEHDNSRNSGFEALLYACRGSYGEAVWDLLNDGYPIRCPQDVRDQLNSEGLRSEDFDPTEMVLHNPHPEPLQALLDFAPPGNVYPVWDSESELRDPSKTRFVSGQNAERAVLLFIKERNVDAVIRLLQRGANPNDPDTDKWPLLLSASWWGSPQILTALIQHGADVRARDENGWTALHVAAGYADVNVIRVLLDGGAHIDALEELDHTPLMLAVGHRSLDKARLLLQRGAHFNLRNKLGRSALSIAAAMGQHMLARLLVAFGADAHSPCSSGHTPLTYAIANGCQRCCWALSNATGVAFEPSSLGVGPLDYTRMAFFDEPDDQLVPLVASVSEWVGHDIKEQDWPFPDVPDPGPLDPGDALLEVFGLYVDLDSD